MSSIIVLDSSDEDESPPKKANLKSTLDMGNHPSSVTNKNAILKTQNSKQRSIPSSITVTQRPLTAGAKTSNNVSMQPVNSSPMTAANINQAISNIVNQERQTPTPPNRGQTGNVIQNQRKRKTPTPPHPHPQSHQSMPPRLAPKPFSAMTNSSPAKAATTVAPLPPIMPMITGVHSMAAAGATPPLQLMATPPHHNMAGLLGLNEQLMINPHLIPSNLPPNTTITAHPNTNPNQNNINNNFKIHLPLKPPVTTTTPSPAASPASSAPSPQLAASPQPMGRMDKNMRRVKPTTLLKSSDDAWLQQRQKQSSQWPPVEMLPPSSTESPKSSSSASSSRQHTPMTSPKSRKSPDVILVTPPSHNSLPTESGTILDLTRSPDKFSTNEVVDLVNTPKAKQINGNGVDTNTSPKSNKSSSEINSSSEKTPETKPEKPPPKPPLEPEYEELIKTCREADPSADMEKLIKSKLLKYYYEVHGDFVKSKSFRKSIYKVMATIKSDPSLVYYNLKTIVDELKVRRKAKVVEEQQAAVPHIKAEILETTIQTPTHTTVPETNSTNTTISAAPTALAEAEASATSCPATTSLSATASTSTGNKKLDEQIKKLNKALYVLTKRIEVLEQADVDWDDDDSSFLQVERFKKRACQIYEKICDLTGESKNAHRLVKKPIKFNETRIPQFNKTLQAFINRTKEFPDYYDVLRMLEHCNRNYNLGLVNFEIKNLAEDAFIKVGKLLQSRRKADLYETVTHYGGNAKDPAKSDPALAAKLNENLKNYKKISDILEKFARKQDMPDEEEEEKAENSSNTETPKTELMETAEPTQVKTEEEEKTSTTINEIINKEELMDIQKKEMDAMKKEDINKDPTIQLEENNVDDENDDDDDDEEEEEDEEDDEDNLEEQVETLANGDCTDNESDNDISVIITKEEEEENYPPKELISNKKYNEIPNNNIGNKTSMEECIEILDKTGDISTNNNNNNSSMECIEIHDNSQEEFIAIEGHKRTNNTPIIHIDSDVENIVCVNNNNNNNNNIEATTKTVQNSEEEEDIIGESLTPPPNGKLKDTPQHINASSSSSPLCTATITTTTTTTKADLKIVHVSSLQLNTNNDSSLCNDLTTSPLANKSLEEIIISDEES